MRRASVRGPSSGGGLRDWLAALAVGLGLVAVLLLLGNDVVPARVPLRLWSGEILPPHNSQHVVDYFSLSHLVSGMALYAAFAAGLPEVPKVRRLVLLLASSAIWEAVENTPQVISLFHNLDGYTGDSIVNSLSDTAFAALGFAAAGWLPRRVSLAAAVLIEAAMAVFLWNGIILGAVRAVASATAL